jgi:hypothetical protein
MISDSGKNLTLMYCINQISRKGWFNKTNPACILQHLHLVVSMLEYIPLMLLIILPNPTSNVATFISFHHMLLRSSPNVPKETCLSLNNSDEYKRYHSIYNDQTCVQRPPLGPEKSNHLTEVSDKTEI